jgi:hypothetical protein
MIDEPPIEPAFVGSSFSNFLIFPLILLAMKALPYSIISKFIALNFADDAELFRGGDYTDF